jgi:hypothetical protein
MRFALAVLLFCASAPARAQAPGTTPLPLGMDLRKAPVGAWSEYTVTVADLPPLKQRCALVARDADTQSVEVTSEGGPLGAKGKMVLRFVLEADPAKKDRVRRSIIQIDENDPMELPPGSGQFEPLNPKKQLGGAKLKVAAGSFATKHYRDKAGDGSVLDVWASDQAPPFGIVKLTGHSSEGKNPMAMELSARGSDARPVVTKPPQPFSQEVLAGQMKRAMGVK